MAVALMAAALFATGCSKSGSSGDMSGLARSQDSALVGGDRPGMDACFPDGLKGGCPFPGFRTDTAFCDAVAQKLPGGSVRIGLGMDEIRHAAPGRRRPPLTAPTRGRHRRP